MTEDFSHVWSFDIGTGSFGLAVRRGLEFKDVRSLLIPEGFASTDAARVRRRMFRTREAHKEREKWLRETFIKAGLRDAVLEGRRTVKIPAPGGEGRFVWQTLPGDYRLEREFPPSPGKFARDGAPSDAAGSEICYCGAVLRIRLLQNRPLEPWQIFKALHSAIQKRGYDPDLPWKTREHGNPKSEKTDAGDDEEKETLKQSSRAQQELDALPEGCRLPCYLEAMRMGLWNPSSPGETLTRQNHHAGAARKIVFPRSAVEAELRALISAAVKQLPTLEPYADALIYGPARVPYASFHPEGRARFQTVTGSPLVRGKATDWQGVLSQKVPTFDNRALNFCAAIPRFHTAKATPRLRPDGTFDPDSLLPAEVTFLMKLKNLRFALPGGETGGFTHEQIAEIFAERTAEVTRKRDAAAFSLTKTRLQKAVERHGGVALLPNQTVVEAPRLSGRSRYSRPALKLIKRLILSGKSPAEIHAEALAETGGNRDPLKGLVPSDLDFLLRIKSSGGEEASWKNFHLPDESLAFLENTGADSAAKIRALIGRQNNPVIRHRLEMFWTLLQKLEKEHKKPDAIVIEFVREDFMGEKAKRNLEKFQKERREARARARAETGGGKNALLCWQLLQDQGEQCLYCGNSIGLQSEWHLDHIVPESQGGPGAYWNFAVCCHSCNDAKKERTPWLWFHQDADRRPGWDAYVARVRARTPQLRPKKARLLTQEDAAEQVERYQTLAETAWIARLAQTLVCLHFGWPRNFAGGRRRVVVLPGGLTARVRRKYQLNSLLGQEIAALEEKLKNGGDSKVEKEIESKCRDDKRHHALDAMILSFLPQWGADPSKRVNVRLPEQVHREFFRPLLENVVPTLLCFEKPALEDSAYGLRVSPETRKPVATKRNELNKLGYTGINPVFKTSTLEKHVDQILDAGIRAAIRQFVQTANPDAEAWQRFCAAFRQPGSGQDGPLVKTVRLVVSDNLDEFSDLSKGDRNLAGKPSPALRKGARHRGYFIYTDMKQRPRVRPVYAFQSVALVRRELVSRQGQEVAGIIGFFQSGCVVKLEREVVQGNKKLKPGLYKLNTIKTQGQAKLTSSSGVEYEALSLSRLVEAGFHRI